jgi:hypothetical protein
LGRGCGRQSSWNEVGDAAHDSLEHARKCYGNGGLDTEWEALVAEVPSGNHARAVMQYARVIWGVQPLGK